MNYEKSVRPFHPWDRNLLLLIVALIWLGILMGFVPEILDRIRTQRPFPLVIYFHGTVFFSWLILLSVQLLLVRCGRIDIHRKLGVWGAVLAGMMVILGIAATIVAGYTEFGTKDSDPPFVSIQLGGMLVFGPLVAAAILLRRQPVAHKRLMLLATIFISDAGFARWWQDGLERLLGNGFWGQYAQIYLGDALLVAMFAVYDLITRGRLAPAFVAGAAWGISMELLAIWLYLRPWWRPVATLLIGR
jgi:hypothetical protein